MRSLLIAASILLIGCASPAYRAFDGTAGYSQAQTAPGEWDVSYVAPAGMAPAQAIELATIRAAEIAIERGKSYLEIVKRENSVISSTESSAPYTDVYERVDGDGRRRSQVFTQSGGVRTINRPATIVTVTLLDAPTARSLEAQSILDDARARGLLSAPN